MATASDGPIVAAGLVSAAFSSDKDVSMSQVMRESCTERKQSDVQRREVALAGKVDKRGARLRAEEEERCRERHSTRASE